MMKNNTLKKTKHVPCRMCLVCKERKTKDLLLRFSFDSMNKFNMSKKFGKGFYLCRKLECINKLFSVKSLKKKYLDTMTEDTIEKIIKYVDFLKNMSNIKEKNDEMRSL